ncbi:MAG: hypothetical protein KDI88_19090 [Gammaproteobacteria bacterium]|nr:hypothetical protein [Gammaproteobacteria bacterium]
MTSESTSFDSERVYAEQVAYLFKPLLLSVAATLVGVALFAAAQWPVVDHDRILGWISLVGVVTVLRVILALAYRRFSTTRLSPRWWGHLFVFGAGLAGIAWGVGGILLFPPGIVEHQVIVVLVIVGICAGGTTTLSVVPLAAYLFLVPAMLPVAYLFLTTGHPVSFIVGLMLLLSFGFFLSSTKNTYTNTRQNILLRIAAENRERSLVEANREIERNSRAKSDFMANISHEIRTPLNVIIGMHHQLSRMPLTAEQSQVLGKAERAAGALRDIVDTVLDFSKAERGLIELDVATFDLPALIADIGAGIALQARSRKLQFSSETAPDVPTSLIGDAGRLRQVLMILLGNALKFTVHGSVALVIRRAPSPPGEVRLVFAVRDTGPGIESDLLASSMRPFSQGDSSSTRRHGGIGMGLATALRLVKVMDGELQVDSEPGRGSEFRVVCPFRVGSDDGRRSVKAEDLRQPNAEAGSNDIAHVDVDVGELLRSLYAQVEDYDTEALNTARQLCGAGALADPDNLCEPLLSALNAYAFEAAAELLKERLGDASETDSDGTVDEARVSGSRPAR